MQTLKSFKNRTMVGIAGLLLVTACASSPDIYVDQDPKQDFSQYKSYAWAKNPPMATDGTYKISPFAEQHISAAIQQSLAAKGYRYTENLSSADFAVAYTLGARDKIETEAMPDPFYGSYGGWGWGYPYYPMGPAYMEPQYSTYTTTQGTLAIDVYDVSRKQPVWHGVAQKNISQKELTEGAKDIQPVVDSVFEKFPSVGQTAAASSDS